MITPLGERLVKLAKNLLEFHADALKVIDDLVRRLEAAQATVPPAPEPEDAWCCETCESLARYAQ